ncbi:MAG: TIGR01777 family oxidoreductase [Bacteroidetes bacterium]|nr:TIGR01777 family oxidoreductase [Bacteroidota bacterium]
MNILIAGATGLIGTVLTEQFASEGHQVQILSRNTFRKNRENISYAGWDGHKISGLRTGFDVIINLSGASIGNHGWTRSYRKELHQSRILATRAFADLINDAGKKPTVFINASATGFYGNRPSEELTEFSAGGTGFLAHLTQDWENEALKIRSRTVCLRFGMVLSAKDGAFPKLKKAIKAGICGIPGSGRQVVPWIHILDIPGIVNFIIENENIKGPVNAVAPEKTSLKLILKLTGKKKGAFMYLPIPAFLIRLFMGGRSSLLLHNQHVTPSKLISNGFVFKFPDIRQTFDDLSNK